MMRKLDEFEQEMNDYAANHARNTGGKNLKFSLSNSVKAELVHKARGPGASIQSVIDSLRPSVQQLIVDPEYFLKPRPNITLH
ncbi:hypothetical protein KKH81_01040 [Patescibacteria group bacterium]|nr:hypothetical protein [Patescibacteria group bacterium]